MITLQQAHAAWLDLYRASGASMDDEPMQSESWCGYTDLLCRSGDITSMQYHYAPAWDEYMPNNSTLTEEAEWLVRQHTEDHHDLDELGFLGARQLWLLLGDQYAEDVAELMS